MKTKMVRADREHLAVMRIARAIRALKSAMDEYLKATAKPLPPFLVGPQRKRRT